MLICGDFVYPFEEDKDFICMKDKNSQFLSSPKIVNFESTLSSTNMGNIPTNSSGVGLYSSTKSINILNRLNVKGVTLANNHTSDFKVNSECFLEKFHSNNIGTVGFGSNSSDAKKPLDINGYTFVNFGWEVIGCVAAKKDTYGVNPIVYKDVLHQVENLVADGRKVVVIFHWNYEFEIYPQPAHRKLAKVLVDLGVEAVIGHHSHVIQGAEIYKGKPIVYGLGNFYFPEYNFNGFITKYPEIAYTGLSFNIENLESYIIHLNNNDIEIEGPIPLLENEIVQLKSSFAGMSDEEYLTFFKANRVKRKLLPIYNDWNWQVKVFDSFVIYRQLLINFLVRFNLKKYKK